MHARRVYVARAGIVGVVVAIVASGCFRSHSREHVDARAMDAGPEDGGVDAGRDGGRDGGPDAARDAGVDASDAGPDGGACLDERDDENLLRACVFDPLGALAAGEQGLVTLGFVDCLCDARACEVSVEGSVIDLSVATCADRRECDDCQRDLRCAIPALAEGDYELRYRGRLLASLPVRARTMSRLAHPTCWRPQEISTAERCEGIWPGSPPTGPMQICHRDMEDVGTYSPIELTVSCPACAGSPGQCAVRLDGRQLIVDATIRECGCPRCDRCPVCDGLPGDFTARLHCSTPPLPIGDYEVVVAGTALRSTFRVRDVTAPGPLVCTSLP